VDKASTLAGQVCSWSIVVLTALISWEVFSRYVLNVPHAWVLDAQIMLYGVLFMMAGAYTCPRRATSAATCSTASSSRAPRRSGT
jgi:TRAP-type mannitol/chloroaromatic compound transport system permease small subunit